MALPWLIGAAVVATVGYLASSSSNSSNDDDDYFEKKIRKRKRKEKKKLSKKVKNDFFIKWQVEYMSDWVNVPKIKELENKKKRIEKDIKKLISQISEIKEL